MAYNELASANISLATAASERVGFGIPLFVGDHAFFSERVRSYGKLEDVAADVPTDSNTYRAAQSAFSQSNGLKELMIGRRRSDVVLSVATPALGTTYAVKVDTNDDATVTASVVGGNYLTDCSFAPINIVDTTSTHEVTITVNDADAISINATGGADAEAVVDLIVAAINGDASVSTHVTASKVGTGADAVVRVVANTLGDYFITSAVNSNLVETKVPTVQAILTEMDDIIKAVTDVTDHVSSAVTGTVNATTLTLSHVAATDEFTVTSVEGMRVSSTSTESAADIISAINEENDGYYFVTAEDKSEAFVLAMADQVQGMDKQYYVSIKEVDSHTVLADPAIDTLGKLKAGDYSRTVGFYHQSAEDSFEELSAVAFNAPFESGRVTWSNLNTSGVAASTNFTTGKKLSRTEKSNLLERRAAFWDISGGVVHLSSDVKTMSGERPENIRGRDNMVADIVAAIRDLMISQTGGKVTYTNRGMAQIENVVSDVLSVYVRRGFIEDNFRITTPDINTISAGKRASQIFDELTFVAQLSGAITMVSITGSLQLSEVTA